MPPTLASLVRQLRAVASSVGDAWPRIVGAPDYSAYVAHLAVHHPDERPMPEDEFRRASLDARYRAAGARCC